MTPFFEWEKLSIEESKKGTQIRNKILILVMLGGRITDIYSSEFLKFFYNVVYFLNDHPTLKKKFFKPSQDSINQWFSVGVCSSTVDTGKRVVCLVVAFPGRHRWHFHKLLRTVSGKELSHVTSKCLWTFTQGTKSTYNYLSLKPNSILQINTQDFMQDFTIHSICREYNSREHCFEFCQKFFTILAKSCN